MKLFFTIIIALSTVSLVKDETVLSFNKTTIKFPDTKEGEILKHSFEFQNTGSSPAIITDYKVSCPCTKAVYPSQPILPGEKGKVEITFDTNGKYGYQDRTVELYYNSKKSPLKLRFKVYVYNVEE